ncbi:MAG TPA: hypothetical protein VK588_00910 [Chitinophagaceae bacterium]|nr:hypothetical protein [Chitinophagaceae bacterium]
MKKIIASFLVVVSILGSTNIYSKEINPIHSVKKNGKPLKDVSIVVQTCIGLYLDGACFGYYHQETVVIHTPDVAGSKIAMPKFLEAVLSSDGKRLVFQNLPSNVQTVTFQKDFVVSNDKKTTSVSVKKGTYTVNATKQYVESTVTSTMPANTN